LDIGDNLNRADKLSALRGFVNISGIHEWQHIVPDSHGDWINQRKVDFAHFMGLATVKGGTEQGIFRSNSMGIKSNRDAWVYNFSRAVLRHSMETTIAFYNEEVKRLETTSPAALNGALDRDETKIKWTTDIATDLVKKRTHAFEEDAIVIGIYRPFQKVFFYSNKSWNWTRHLMPSYFPSNHTNNKVICVSGVGARAGFSALMSKASPIFIPSTRGSAFRSRSSKQRSQGRLGI
jgi:predicted helicase